MWEAFILHPHLLTLFLLALISCSFNPAFPDDLPLGLFFPLACKPFFSRAFFIFWVCYQIECVWTKNFVSLLKPFQPSQQTWPSWILSHWIFSFKLEISSLFLFTVVICPCPEDSLSQISLTRRNCMSPQWLLLLTLISLCQDFKNNSLLLTSTSKS